MAQTFGVQLPEVGQGRKRVVRMVRTRFPDPRGDTLRLTPNRGASEIQREKVCIGRRSRGHTDKEVVRMVAVLMIHRLRQRQHLIGRDLRCVRHMYVATSTGTPRSPHCEERSSVRSSGIQVQLCRLVIPTHHGPSR